MSRVNALSWSHWLVTGLLLAGLWGPSAFFH